MISKHLWTGILATLLAVAGCDGGSGSSGDGGDGGGGDGTGGKGTGGTGTGSSTGGTGTGGSTGGGGAGAGLTCAQLQDCYAACQDAACGQDCYDKASPEAKAQDDAMYGCIEQQGCVVNNQIDADCAYAKCGPEIAACVGGATGCNPPCSAGSECQNGQCVPIAAGPECDPNNAELTVNTLIACVEAKSAIDGKCDVANQVWDGISCCARISECALELFEPPCSVCMVSTATDATTCNYGGFDLTACFE